MVSMELVAGCLVLSKKLYMTECTLAEADSNAIPAPHDNVLLPKALGCLLSHDSVIALESTRFDSEVERLLQPYIIAPRLTIRPGTGWPKSHWVHFEARPEALNVFEDLIKRIEMPVLCNHLYAYSQQGLLLQWHDAFTNNSIRVSLQLPQSAVVEFCSVLGVKPPNRTQPSKRSNGSAE
jgi:hypothetical protein